MRHRRRQRCNCLAIGVPMMGNLAEIIRDFVRDGISFCLSIDLPLGFALSDEMDSSANIPAVSKLEPGAEINSLSFSATRADIDEKKWVEILSHCIGAIPDKAVLGLTDLATDLDDAIRVSVGSELYLWSGKEIYGGSYGESKFQSSRDWSLCERVAVVAIPIVKDSLGCSLQMARLFLRICRWWFSCKWRVGRSLDCVVW